MNDNNEYLELSCSISYPLNGVWHYNSSPWIGPIRLPNESINKWCDRYTTAAREFLGIDPITMVITEWEDVSNPYRTLIKNET